MSDITPLSIQSNGVIRATDSQGRIHQYHTDPRESEAFGFSLKCLSAGAQELGYLLGYQDDPNNRSVPQLKQDWLTKVTSVGYPLKLAEDFLTQRLTLD